MSGISMIFVTLWEKNLRGVTLKLPTVNLQKPITAVEQIFNEELSGSRKPVCISMKDCPDC